MYQSNLQNGRCENVPKNKEKEVIAKKGPQKSGSAEGSVDYDYFLNDLSKNREPDYLREMGYLISKLPAETIKFGAGIPNVDTFPFKDIQVSLKDNSSIMIEGDKLADALQYLPSPGYNPLIDSLKGLQDRVHGSQDWSKRNLILTCGSMEAFCKSVEMLMEPGDPIILPNPLYTGTIDCFLPYNCENILVDTDQDGMRTDILKKKLADRKKENKRMPKVLYANPTASNPCGVTLSVERKREIYQMACEYNFLIIEDDPYYYLCYDEEDPVSFLSMDTEGRVIRCDSFSKFLSSGLRVGFVTGPTVLIRRLELHVQVSSIHASALSQVLLYQLLNKWGYEGLRKHLSTVKQFYRERRDLMLSAVQKYLTGLAEWNNPEGGMFLWLRIKGMDNVHTLVTKSCIDNLLVCVPGHAFSTDHSIPSPNIRLSFSMCSKEDIHEGVRRLAYLIREELKESSSR